MACRLHIFIKYHNDLGIPCLWRSTLDLLNLSCIYITFRGNNERLSSSHNLRAPFFKISHFTAFGFLETEGVLSGGPEPTTAFDPLDCSRSSWTSNLKQLTAPHHKELGAIIDECLSELWRLARDNILPWPSRESRSTTTPVLTVLRHPGILVQAMWKDYNFTGRLEK